MAATTVCFQSILSVLLKGVLDDLSDLPDCDADRWNQLCDHATCPEDQYSAELRAHTAYSPTKMTHLTDVADYKQLRAGSSAWIHYELREPLQVDIDRCMSEARSVTLVACKCIVPTKPVVIVVLRGCKEADHTIDAVHESLKCQIARVSDVFRAGKENYIECARNSGTFRRLAMEAASKRLSIDG